MARRDYTHGGRGSGASARELTDMPSVLVLRDGQTIVTLPSRYVMSFETLDLARAELTRLGHKVFRYTDPRRLR
jgi:hypothetical protein